MVNGLLSAGRVSGVLRSLLALWVAAVTMSGVVSAAEVEATLDRASVPAGEGALLTLSISGASPGRPEIPAVDKLIVQPRGQQQKIQMFNGSIVRSVDYTFVVGSNTAGDYVIPAIQVEVGGQMLSSQPLKLKVLDAGAARPPAGIPPGNAGGQAAEPPQEEDATDRFGSLTVELVGIERDHVYVGEIAPVRIRAWLPADSQAQLRSGIQPEGKAFTLHNVNDRPDQRMEIKDGKQYLVVTWFGGISATKAGKYPVSLSLDATVAVRDNNAPRQRRRRSGPFSSSFFDDAFDQMYAPVIQKDVTLKSEDEEIEVRALPAEGRPEGFSGAVGKFKLESYDIPQEWKTGEPQQITAQIGGSGNFALLNAPELTPADTWKAYPGKDEFMPGDQAAFSGSKRFQFSALARKGGDQDAGLKFSYFDPDSAVYQTVEGSPKRIRVSGEDLVEEEPAALSEPVRKEEKKPGMIGQHTRPAPVATLIPLVSRNAFVPLLGASAGMVVLGGVFGLLRVRRNDPGRIARAAMERATREAREAAVKCADAREVAGFFTAARLALQHRLGAMWGQPAQAITSAEVASRLPADSPVSRFFREADRYDYNRVSGGEVQPEWRALFEDALASLNPSLS
jgi:hypothetical protein